LAYATFQNHCTLLSTILLQRDTGYIIQDPDHTVELIPDFRGFQIIPNSATHKYNYSIHFPGFTVPSLTPKRDQTSVADPGGLSRITEQGKKNHQIPDPGTTMNLQRLSICNSKTVTKLSEI
jgi:hypothetical protein